MKPKYSSVQRNTIGFFTTSAVYNHATRIFVIDVVSCYKNILGTIFLSPHKEEERPPPPLRQDRRALFATPLLPHHHRRLLHAVDIHHQLPVTGIRFRSLHSDSRVQIILHADNPGGRALPSQIAHSQGADFEVVGGHHSAVHDAQTFPLVGARRAMNRCLDVWTK